MGRGLVVIVTVLLIGMAGCTTSGIAVSSQSTTTPTPDEASNETFPPGTSASGIDNATKLLETHRSVLNNSTYLEQVESAEVTAVTAANETFRGFEVTSSAISVERGSNSTLVTLEGGTVSMVYWLTDTAAAVKTTDYSTNLTSTTYGYGQDGPFSQTPSQAHSTWINGLAQVELYQYLHGLDYGYTDTVTHNNQTVYRFTSTGQTEQQFAAFPSPIDQVNATVLIDEQGVIRAVNTSETRSRGNQTVTTGVNYSVRTSESVMPSEPEWVTTELPHLNASLSGNGTVITVEHTGGMPVTNASLTLSSPAGSASGELTETIEPSDTLYLYRTQNATDQIKVSRNEHPVVNESVVAFGGEQLSLAVNRAVYDTYDAGVMVQLTVKNESATNNSDPSIPTRYPK